jgi:hypothetical protein
MSSHRDMAEEINLIYESLGSKRWLVGLVIALRPQTPKHIRGCWSHYTDNSEPVDGNGAQKYGHCPIRV